VTTLPTPAARQPAFTFRGTVSDDAAAFLAATDGAVIVASGSALGCAIGRDACSRAATVLTVDDRPDWATVEELVGRLSQNSSNRVVGIGDGSVMDAAKLAAFIVGSEPERSYPAVALAPAGREPYRAVAAFAVIDRDGERPTTQDPAIAAADVLLVDELIETVEERTFALVAADLAVMTVDSLMSRRSFGLHRSLAIGALDGVAGWLEGTGLATPTTARTNLVVGSFLATEAMMATRLGIAHAIASPLGTATGLTHDAINAILGPYVIQKWRGETATVATIARALRLPPDAGHVLDALNRLRSDAGLPASLRELGIAWSAVERSLPSAARSSGLPLLPVPLGPEELEAFAMAAWSGEGSKAGKELNHAGT
jgi:alcohol dehydrogenase class IV